MKYVGSKARYAGELLPLILRGRTDEPYVEPFVGGANMIERVLGRRIGNDVNPYIIAMYRAIQDGWVPPNHVSERQYYHMRQFKHRYPPELVGFVGTVCAFGAQWFGAYARGKRGDNDHVNYALQGKRQLLEDRHRLMGIEFHSGDYRDFPIPPGSIIYCDPPYAAVHQPYHERFNSEAFWSWVREMAGSHRIYVSEYEAPDDFRCIWQKRTSSSQSDSVWTLATERLFVPM